MYKTERTPDQTNAFGIFHLSLIKKIKNDISPVAFVEADLSDFADA